MLPSFEKYPSRISRPSLDRDFNTEITSLRDEIIELRKLSDINQYMRFIRGSTSSNSPLYVVNKILSYYAFSSSSSSLLTLFRFIALWSLLRMLRERLKSFGFESVLIFFFSCLNCKFVITNTAGWL